MAYRQDTQNPVSATFVPGGHDDYYMPAPQPELVSPSPQRLIPEAPQNIQDGIAQLELNSNRPAPTHTPVDDSMSRGYAGRPAAGGHNYSMSSHAPADVPNFSPFPKINPLPPNVPPSDDEKESILWDARAPVLSSNDPEMQLAWAQDALAYVDAAMTHEARMSETQPARSVTPEVEHQLRLDSMNIVSFLADQHHPKAEFMRGMWLEFGKFGLRQDKREAFRSYQRAAERGYARAEYRMGMQFEQSNDSMKALQHYQMGAEAGDSASNYRLGMMTLLGQAGQGQDYARGVHLLEQAAATADENAPQGAYVLGMLQAHELKQVQVPESYLPYDEKAARANIEKAAYLGFAKAQLKMGSAYELCTLGCEFNPALSLHYNALASRQGEVEADMAISKWFLCGSEGIFQKNEDLAYTYGYRAALAGLPTAMFGMGYFYEIGLHVPVDLNRALEWYEKAAGAGNADAEQRIRAINNSQTLSKKDHENVAISRIKSTHGSKRGKRPDRLAGRAAAPSLPTVSDEYGEDGYDDGQMQRGGLPPRTSSTTPYPMSDGPPSVSPRPGSAAPYPMSDGPPSVGGRPGMGGGFGPEMRSSSVGTPKPNRGPSLPAGPAPWQQRPYSNIDDRAPNARMGTSSVPPPSGYRQPSGTASPGPMLPPKEPLGQQPMFVGYSAPDDAGRKRLQKPGGLQGKSVSPDYVQPLNVGKQRPGGSPVSSGYQSAGPLPPLDRPPRTDSWSAHSSGRTSSPSYAPGVGLRPGGSNPPSRPTSGGRSPVSSVAGTQRPAAQQSQASKPAARPPGKGPKTFEDMGIPAKKQDDDCVIM